jgi:hypothetical protein
MKATKLIVVAIFAAMTLTIAGRADAGGRNSRPSHRAVVAQHNRRFFHSVQTFPYYPYNGYGNGFVLNSDEADWAEQWQSVREDNDGPYARSVRENPPGEARMWVFPDK